MSNQQNTSQTEQLWNAICAKMLGEVFPWNEVPPMNQMQFIQGINLILDSLPQKQPMEG